MTGHLTPDQRQRFTRLAMAPEELLAADEHLAGCTQCRDEIAIKLPIIEQIADVQAGLSREASAPAHLSFELLLRYLENRLGGIDKEAVRGHVALCPNCSAELEDLLRFRAEMSTYVNRSYAPAKPLTLIERLTRRRPVRRSLGIMGMSAVAAAMLVTVIMHRPLKGALPDTTISSIGLPDRPGAAHAPNQYNASSPVMPLHSKPKKSKKGQRPFPMSPTNGSSKPETEPQK